MIHYTMCDAGKNMRQESREKEKESDSSAGRKRETICYWLPAVPPLSPLTFPLFFLHISPAVYEGAQSVSVRALARTHRGLRWEQNKQASKKVSVSLNLRLYILYLSCPSSARSWLQLRPYPRRTCIFFSLSLNAPRWHTQTDSTNTQNRYTHTERGSL